MLPVRSWFGLAAVVVLAALVQTTLVPLCAIRGIKPDLMIALVVWLSLRAHWYDVFAANCALGVLRDVFSAAPIGTFGLLFLLCGHLVGWIGRYVSGRNWFAQVIAAFVAVVLCNAAAGIRLGFPLQHVLGEAAYTALLMPILAWVMARPARWLKLPEKA